MNKIIQLVSVSFTLLLVITTNTSAQSGLSDQAILFSQTTFGGTARFMGIGGAGTALGGDISSLSLNPAGIGFFKNPQASFTAGLFFGNTSADYLNTTSTDNFFGASLPNAGVVFVNKKSGSLKTVNYGISLTRNNLLKTSVNYSGVNEETSIIDFFAEADDNLAFETFLIDGPGATQIPFDPVFQQEKINARGIQNRFDFSIGANYEDQLFFGASLGVATINYRSDIQYFEENRGPEVTNIWKDLELKDQLNIEGAGIDLTAGVIYRKGFIQLGASLRTPTFYRVNETFASDLTSSYVDFQYDLDFDNITDTVLNGAVFAETPIVESDYNLISPFRANVGAAVFAGERGFVSADIEFVNYSATRLRGGTADADFSGDNQAIRELYRSTFNYRIGGEYRYNIFRARAGFAYYGDPTKDGVDELADRSRTSFTGGVGAHFNRFHIDAAVVHTKNASGRSPYVLASELHPSAVIDNNTTELVITFGLNF